MVPLWKGQGCLTKVAKFGPFPCTILYKSCLFYPSWQATSFERPPSWVAFIEGFHCSEYKRILASKWRTSYGVLWRTCKAILKPVYRNLTRGDAICDVTRTSRVAPSYWPMYNHKVTIITFIPIFIQMAALLYFQHICINKVTPIIAHLSSIHPYGNTLKYILYSLSIPASNLKTPGVDINQISTRIEYRYLTHINRGITIPNVYELKQHRQAQTWPRVSVSPGWSRDHNNRIYTRIFTYMK